MTEKVEPEPTLSKKALTKRKKKKLKEQKDFEKWFTSWEKNIKGEKQKGVALIYSSVISYA